MVHGIATKTHSPKPPGSKNKYYDFMVLFPGIDLVDYVIIPIIYCMSSKSIGRQ
jgi:hypothetical protein